MVDLLVLTAVVHFTGSMETYLPFTYLFHIVLACVFFSRKQSFIVAITACVLYVGCILAEQSQIIPFESIYAGNFFQHRLGDKPAVYVGITSAMVIWLVVWYLASKLSGMVRERDIVLAETNYRLVAAQQERSRHMLHTTHELKSPFSAIHANAQLLLKGHCGELPDEAAQVVSRIAARSRRLAQEIHEMLQLANLRSVGQKDLPRVDLSLDELLRGCVAQVQPIAESHGITIAQDIQPSQTFGCADHLRMLFINLLSNAVIYSYEGKQVRIASVCGPDDKPVVIIEDQGIGIPADKLPRIFDEHYRTIEAVRHNKESSGLGLAIVRNVVQIHGIQMQVKSSPGVGTTFELNLPSGQGPGAMAVTEEKNDGLSDDS